MRVYAWVLGVIVLAVAGLAGRGLTHGFDDDDHRPLCTHPTPNIVCCNGLAGPACVIGTTTTTLPEPCPPPVVVSCPADKCVYRAIRRARDRGWEKHGMTDITIGKRGCP